MVTKVLSVAMPLNDCKIVIYTLLGVDALAMRGLRTLENNCQTELYRTRRFSKVN